MLSSDSEAEEFFDAEDTNGIAKNLLLLEKKKREQDSLAAEEERILELRRVTEERRRHEDEQLAHRLQELHSKKEKRESADIENIKDELAPDDELRRQKLEMLRSQLSTDSTPNKEPDTLDTVFLTSILPSDSQEFRSEYTDTGQKQDECAMRLDANSDDKNMGVGVKHDHLLLSRETDQRESKHSGLSVNLVKNKPDSCVLLTSSLDDHRSLYVRMPECDKTRPKSPEKFWEQSKNIDSDYPMKEKLIKEIPEIVPEQCVIVGHVNQKLEDLISDSFQSTSSKLNDSINDSVFIHNSDDEPDIVKSTKSRNTTPTQSLGREVNPSNIQVLVREVSPPDTLLPPVAPPRRKKRNRAAQSGNSISESSTEVRPLSNISLEPMSPGLPPSVDTPTADIIRHLVKGLDHSLDIQSVIDGKRLIRTEEAEIGAINSDKSLSPDVSHLLLREKLRVQRLSGETSSSCGTSSLPSSPRPKRPERTISTQSHSDEDIAMRPRSNSGRLLTDKEILESVMVLNLDTGEQIPLSVAEEKLAKCMNPLALYIMRRTKEYNSDSNLQKQFDNLTDDDVDAKSEGGVSSGSSEQSAKTKAVKLKKLIGRTMGKTMHKVKHVAEQGRKVLEGDETGMEEEFSVDGKRFKFKASRQNKGPYDFSRFRILQDLAGEHTGAVWTMKFSTCGRLLATGGQDSILRVWVLKSAHAYFDELRQKYSEVRVSPAPSHESLDSISSDNSAGPIPAPDDGDKHAPFMKKPFCVYRGHIADLLDLSWSKNYFILSSSMDKTVRLWHISRKECLCTFQHIDFVTAIAFHPRDDRYFLSGSLDGKLRLWNIPDKNVALWNEVGSPSNLITTANFCQNGKFAVVGTYDGKCIFYSTEQLKYYTQIHVRSTRGKNARGRKITGIEPLPTEDKILVTSNDSRIRLYDLRDLTLTGKYKGCTNNSSQIKASFSSGGKYIICGSEDQFMYIWKTHHDYYKFSSARRDRNDYWEAIKVHNAVVTTAIFASHPMLFFPDHADTQSMPPLSDETSSQQGEIIISADFSGTIKVIQNKISVIA